MKLQEGICFVCGCTDQEGCWDGCTWTDKERTLCSSCVMLSVDGRERVRGENLKGLRARVNEHARLAEMLEERIRVLEAPMPAQKRKPQQTRKSQHPRFPKMGAT